MNTNPKTLRLAQAALVAALCYIGFQFFRIDVPVGEAKTAFHFGNVFCVLGALLLGGPLGGIAASIGMGIADLTSGYAMYFPQTFIMKFLIGTIVGMLAHKVAHLSSLKDSKKIILWTILSGIGGMAFNVIVDPLIGYVYKVHILGVPAQVGDILLKYSALTTFVNAILAVTFSSIIYLSLRPILIKTNLFPNVN